MLHKVFRFTVHRVKYASTCKYTKLQYLYVIPALAWINIISTKIITPFGNPSIVILNGS